MASLYTDELYFHHALSTDTVDIPYNERWVIRTATLFSSGLGGGAWFQIQRLADSLTLYDLETATGLFDEYKEDNEIRIVLVESKQYHMKAGGGPDVTLFGYKLSVP